MSANARPRHVCGVVLLAGLFTIPVASAGAQTLSFLPAQRYDNVFPQYASQEQEQSAPRQDDAVTQDDGDLAPALRRQVVSYPSNEPPGTIIIDTAHTFLYLTLGNGMAYRYGIGVGRQGFTWSGVETITRMAEWPDWIPPAEMVARQPYLPRWVGGGPGNPLGARALYLGNTDYRIHGTNDPSSIGKHVSSGCIRMLNADVMDLYRRVRLGTKVIVLPNQQRRAGLDDARGAAALTPVAARPAASFASGGAMRRGDFALPAIH